MRERAVQVADTRRRLVEAAMFLHGTVGPAATTVAGIAEQAGVTRLTVYRHFPDQEAVFAACSAHWASQQVPPDTDAWAAISDPEQRVRVGLADLYRFYRSGEDMLTRIYADLDALPESHRLGLQDRHRRHRDLLVGPFGRTGARRQRLRAVLGHATSFATWRSLCVDNGLSNAAAVEAMTALVLATADP